MTNTSRCVVFFDLDKTLISRSSGELYLKVMREQGLVRKRDMARIIAASVLYRFNLLNPEDIMERFTSRFQGSSEQEMIDFCQHWFHTTVRQYLYTEAIERVRKHREQGHLLALLTAATPYIAEPAAGYLGIEHVLCTRLEVKDGLFTGNLIKPLCHGKGKLFWARQFCEDHGIDLFASYFYTDSSSDLPMLEAVQHPVPVNPDPFLRWVARKRRWAVERFTETIAVNA